MQDVHRRTDGGNGADGGDRTVGDAPRSLVPSYSNGC